MPEIEQTTETAENGPQSAEPPETAPGGQDGPEDVQKAATSDSEGVEPETFPREYVVKLRQEAADARVKAKDRDDLAERLHAALVAATGRLADPTDLPYEANHLDAADALTAAVDDLLARKPHLATRRVSGDVGQGMSGAADTFDLAGLLRSRT